jgi:hypothetical protein
METKLQGQDILRICRRIVRYLDLWQKPDLDLAIK